MKILITGASGFIGDAVLRVLLADGHQVTAAVRDPRRLQVRHPGIPTITVDFVKDQSPEVWLERVAGFEVVVNAVGIIRQHGTQTFEALHSRTPMALFHACMQAGVRRVIQISALGADAQARSEYHLSKRAADDVLTALSLEWTILQPSIVYGPRAKSFAFFKALATLPIIPIVGNGRQPIQPIHIDDLVHAVCMSLSAEQTCGRRIALVGPAPLTMQRWFELLRDWLRLGPARFIHVPYWAALLTGKVMGFAGNTPLTAETIAMLQRGNVGDMTSFQQFFYRSPISFEHALAQTPLLQADVWHAHISALLPLLRWSLVLVWLMAGIVSLGLYPLADSYDLLQRVGVPETWNLPLLVGAASLDIGLGIAFLLRWRITWIGTAMIVVVLGYSIIVAWALPEYLIHPYGPIAKNLPLLVATLLVMRLEEARA